jgi:hypothetical protein
MKGKWSKIGICDTTLEWFDWGLQLCNLEFLHQSSYVSVMNLECYWTHNLENFGAFTCESQEF